VWWLFTSNSCTILLASFTLLAVLIAVKAPIWLVLVLVAVFTSILAGGFTSPYTLLLKTAVSSEAWDLVIPMYLIAVFVTLYRVTGFVKKLEDSMTTALKKPKLVAAVVPAVLGLLPVPGGALMSAPVVDEIGEHLGVDRIRRVFINVWFRHVIFLVYPMSSAIIITSVLTGVELWRIIAYQIPVALVMAALGYVIGFTRAHPTAVGAEEYSKPRKTSLKPAYPVLAATGLSLALSPVLDSLPGLPLTRLSIVAGVLAGIILLKLLSSIDVRALYRVLTAREALEMALVGFGAMYLRVVFSSIDLSCLASSLLQSSRVLMIMLIPAVLSIAAGLVASGVALALSILNGLVEFSAKTASLVYLSAFLGYLVSPLHLCYVLTAQYMKTDLVKPYIYLIPAALLTLALAYTIYTVW